MEKGKVEMTEQEREQAFAWALCRALVEVMRERPDGR